MVFEDVKLIEHLDEGQLYYEYVAVSSEGQKLESWTNYSNSEEEQAIEFFMNKGLIPNPELLL